MSVAIQAPEYLPAELHARYEDIASKLYSVGFCELDSALLVKYLLNEQQWRRVTNNLTRAMNAGDSAEALRWINAQDRLVNQSVKLSDSLCLSPQSRQKHGLAYLSKGGVTQ